MQDHAQVFLLCKKSLKHLLDGEKIRDGRALCSRLPVHISSHICNRGKHQRYSHPHHADKSLLCQIPLGWKLHSLIQRQKKVYSSTTVVVEGFMEGLINICLWEIKQGRICHSGCHWI